MYEQWGVDIVSYDNPRIKVADLALEPIPYNDDSFEIVTAHQVLEHIPKVIYNNGEKRNCLIELFNEVYRVLKDNGQFRFDVPVAGTPQYWGDPTHVSEWLEDSVNYYSGDYFGYHDDYGHKSKFKKAVVQRSVGLEWRLEVILQAIKPCEPPYEL